MDDAAEYLGTNRARLVTEVSEGGVHPLAAVGWMEGASEALEMAGLIGREASRATVAEFRAAVERAAIDSGDLQIKSLAANVEASAEGSAAMTGRRPQPPTAPEFRGVTAVGARFSAPGDVPVTLIAVAGWSDGLELVWGWPTDERERFRDLRSSVREGRPRLSILPWDFDVWDDQGTRYRPVGGGGGGKTKTVRFRPSVPVGVRELTVALRDPDDAHEISSVAVQIDWADSEAAS